MSLPADAVVLAIFAPAIRDPNKIHETLTVPQAGGNTSEFVIFVSDHNGLRVLKYRINIFDHQFGYMGDAIEDEIPVGTHQACDMHIFVINPQIKTFAQK